MSETETYLNRLASMRDRLRRQIDDEVEEAREAIRKPGENTNLHTHNADMDVEGLDNAVGVGRALEHRLTMVDQIISQLTAGGDDYLRSDRERIDAYLTTEGLGDD
jgi:hypothetical protein